MSAGGARRNARALTEREGEGDAVRLATAAVKANLQDVTSGAKRAQEPAGEEQEIGGEGEDSDAEEAGRRE